MAKKGVAPKAGHHERSDSERLKSRPIVSVASTSHASDLDDIGKSLHLFPCKSNVLCMYAIKKVFEE